jgi:tetratricopeptide (TPR) repeat protein
VPFAHRIVLQRRRGGPVLGEDARAMAKVEDRELFHAADDLSLFLHDLPAGEELLRLGAASARSIAFRDSTFLRLALLHVGEGRWADAQRDLRQVSKPGGPLARAYYASLPFVVNQPGELEEIRDALEGWNPIAEPAPAASELEASLAPHLRQWLLGLVALKAGLASQVRDRATAIERTRVPSGAEAVVRSMAATLRAGAAALQNRPGLALDALEEVRGEVPAPLLRNPFYAEEPARYLRAEALQRIGRDREALDWLEFGFADTPAEAAYLAPLHRLQGELYERLGDSERAGENYQRFLRFWSHCDPSLQPLVAETRSRMTRLAEEPRSR